MPRSSASSSMETSTRSAATSVSTRRSTGRWRCTARRCSRRWGKSTVPTASSRSFGRSKDRAESSALPQADRPSLPLDGGRRLRRDVVDHPVNPSHLVGDPGGDPLQELARKPRPIRGHSVYAGYRSEHCSELVGPIVAHYPNALDRQEDRKGLPKLLIQPGQADLLLDDRVGLPQKLQPRLGDLAEDANRQPRARKGMPV